MDAPVAVRLWCRIFCTPEQFLTRAQGPAKLLVDFFVGRPVGAVVVVVMVVAVCRERCGVSGMLCCVVVWCCVLCVARRCVVGVVCE